MQNACFKRTKEKSITKKIDTKPRLSNKPSKTTNSPKENKENRHVKS